MSYVTALRGNTRKRFSQSIWQTMPVNKYGWRLAAEEPEEVKELRMKLAENTSPEEYAAQIAEARKAVQEADKKYASILVKGKQPSIDKALSVKVEAEKNLKKLLNAQTD